MSDERIELLEMLTRAAGYLEEKGVESPRLDAEILLADQLGIKRLDLYLRFDQPVKPRERDAYRERIRRRAAREPVAYILGTCGFHSLELRVTRDVLIPRPETETLVDTALEWLADRTEPRVADVGTGSGCIAAAIAAGCQSARVLATELSEEAAGVARDNLDRLELAGRVEVRTGRTLEPVAADGPFDLIVSNPPYIRTAELAELAPEITEFEPTSALDGGADGLDVYRELIPAAAELLAEGGALMVEVGYDTGEGVQALFREKGFRDVETRADLGGIDRVVSGTWG